MDAKDLRAESTLAERSIDGGAKFAHSAATLHYDRSKSCQEIGSFKVDAQGARPCAVIGPDRVAPPARDSFPKKAPVEPWLSPDPGYRRPPDYPHKMAEYQDPTRNISPRQTFQENMQRIIMPPGYNAVKLNEETAYASKNNKLNVPLDAKYCDVPYNVNPISSDQKNIRNAEHSVSNVNPLLVRGVPHGWPTGSVNVRTLRPYGAPDVYQYPDYASCTGGRAALTRPQASGHEDPSQLYLDPYYHEGNMRFKPYPNIKERYQQTRYEYLGNYPNHYHPPHPFPAHKYEVPKSMPAHPYPGYAQVPLKYSERVSEPVLDGYQRTFNQQGNYGVPFRNPVIHPPYRPVPGNPVQNKLHPYPSDGTNKAVSNKLPYDPNSKIYVDYENPRTKAYPLGDNYYLNDIPRPYHHHAKTQIILPNYPSSNMHGVNPHPYIHLKNYEYARLKGMDPLIMNNPLTKLPMQFSPSTLAISPADSNASNDTAQTHGTSQEDCGYVSQSSITSVRSIESLNRVPMDIYGRYDYRYGPVVRTSPLSKPDSNNQLLKSKKDIRQFISSWSEGDDDNVENSSKRDAKINSPKMQSFTKQFDHAIDQEQLYVLGSVNVPSEELSKYEHIQKVSKLPENIKGYNSLELLNQFEEVIESTNINIPKLPMQRELQIPMNHVGHKQDSLPRAVSPLDVESKISQSVIHKDVGCNFEIKPCSPKMLNVQVAAPVQNILNERVIEKVANPLNRKSPIVLQNAEDNMDIILNHRGMKYSPINTASSCKMINSQLISESSPIDHLKTNYSLQDLESNSGVCLASLPRLDNDIELNFPEVNQQFINANKTESVITTSFPKDLPALDIDRSESNNLRNSVTNAEFEINCHFSPKNKIETENDFSRLSKYRKLKRTIPGDNDVIQAKAQATRVDSVIIKNPDNARIHEEINDASRSGGYLKKEAQEFAINLACQAKNSQALRQSELDGNKNAPNMHEQSEKYSPNEFITHPKSVSLLNKAFNVVEASHNEIDMQSEDLSMSYKDLSNRYLEKAALDMPMNLSPQGRYSINGADEDIRLGKENRDKIKHKNLEVKHNRTQEESKTNEHLNNTSFSDFIVTSKRDQQRITVKCSSECDDTTINNLQTTCENDLNIVKPNNLTNEPVDITISKADEINLNTNSEINSVNEFINVGKEIDGGSVSTEEPCKTSYPKTDRECEDMLYVPKLKRTKNRTDIARRKRSTESGSANVDGNYKVNNKKHKPRLSVNNHSEEPVSKPLMSVPKTGSANVITVKNSQSAVRNEMDCVDAQEMEMNLNSEEKSTTLIVQFSEMTQNKHKIDLNQIKQSVISIENVDMVNDVKLPDPITASHLDNQFLKNSNTTDVFPEHAIPSKPNTCQLIENNLLDNYSKEKENFVIPDNNETLIKDLPEEAQLKNEEHKEFEKCYVSKEEDTIIKQCSESNIQKQRRKELSDSDESKTALNFKNSFCKELFSPRFQNLIYDCTPIENNYLKSTEICLQPALHNQDACTINDELKQNEINEVDVEPNISNKDKNEINENDAKPLHNYLDQNETEQTSITNTNNENINTNLDDLSVENCIPSNISHETNEVMEFKELDNNSEDLRTCNEKEGLFNELKSNPIIKTTTDRSEDVEKPIQSCKQISSEEKAINKCDDFFFDTSLSLNDDGEPLANNDEKNSDEVQELCDQEIGKMYSPDVSPNYLDTVYKNFCDKPLYSLKRSLSDSALNAFKNDADKCLEKRYIMFPKKRQKCYNSSNIDESQLLNIIQNSRRNSISTVCNENNISFCIFIDDNCIIEEEHYDQEDTNVTETRDDILNDDYKESIAQGEQNMSLTNNHLVEEICSDVNAADDDKVKSWVEDIDYEEIIETEDIAENIVIGGPNSPKNTDSSDYESDDGDTGILSSAAVEHTNKVKHIYGDNMCTDDAQLVDALYRTPQMDVNKKLMDRESQMTEKTAKYYDSDSLEMLLAEPISNYQHIAHESDTEIKKSSYQTSHQHSDSKENVKICSQDSSTQLINCNGYNNVSVNDIHNSEFGKSLTHLKVNNKAYNSTVFSCESSLDNVFSYDDQEDSSYTSSSPEVSSTTSEEKCSSIHLKMSNHKQTTSEVKILNFDKHTENSCKFTEKEYLNPDNNSLSKHRPLITKGAQKYIPPLRESIPDLKVKLTLPQQSLLKLKNNKLSKEEPKLSTCNTNYNIKVNPKKEMPKKVKPKFEDVLKNIDEVQIQKHKEKNKKPKKIIPKVVIKKAGNGSHYASTSSKSSFNPDLTGRKWQPWVFIEKNHFIDKMALRNKTRAVFSHRKKTFVLNEKFYKYKSISSAKFIISQPKLDEYSTGNLKYTIKLKHSY